MKAAAGSSNPLFHGPQPGPRLAGAAGALRDLGYDPDGVRAVLGVTGDLPTTSADLAIYERRLTATPGQLADVIALFVLGRPVPPDRLAAAFGTAVLDAFIASGAVAERDGLVDPAIQLIPHGELLLAADKRSAPGTRIDPLHVTGISPPTNLLAALTVHRGSGTALDVGTGNGIQSLLMAPHCDRVVATDVNPRALAFAAFNAALNGIDTIEFRAGSRLEPVAGERFDLIVCNAPYAISPESELVFRDSGEEPGVWCAGLVAAIPDHLDDGGYATVLASWPLGASDIWSDVPRSWLGPDCCAWLLQLSVADPLEHARQWNAQLALERDLPAFVDAVDRWTSYTAERDIERIGYGAVIIQQQAGRRMVVRADEVRAGHGNAGRHVERVFAAATLLVGLSDEVLAERTFQVPEELRVERGVQLVDGDWQQGSAVVTLAEGVGIEATLDPLMTEVFLRVTSGLSVRAAATEAGRFAGVPLEQLDDLVVAAVAMARDLLALGLVLVCRA